MSSIVPINLADHVIATLREHEAELRQEAFYACRCSDPSLVAMLRLTVT